MHTHPNHHQPTTIETLLAEIFGDLLCDEAAPESPKQRGERLVARHRHRVIHAKLDAARLAAAESGDWETFAKLEHAEDSLHAIGRVWASLTVFKPETWEIAELAAEKIGQPKLVEEVRVVKDFYERAARLMESRHTEVPPRPVRARAHGL